jgi:hypothetical protein
MPWVLFGVVALALLALGGKAVIDAAAEKADANGVVQAEPYEIAAAHGLSLDAEALARLGPSEAGSSKAAQTAVMWATVNYAKRAGLSVSQLLLRGRLKSGLPSSSEGKFGAQNTGKYASTRSPSTSQSRELAVGILGGKIPDPTKGATQYDAPAAQDALVGKATGYVKTSADIAAERSKTSTLVMVPGVSNIRFWAPKGSKTA